MNALALAVYPPVVLGDEVHRDHMRSAAPSDISAPVRAAKASRSGSTNGELRMSRKVSRRSASNDGRARSTATGAVSGLMAVAAEHGDQRCHRGHPLRLHAGNTGDLPDVGERRCGRQAGRGLVAACARADGVALLARPRLRHRSVVLALQTRVARRSVAPRMPRVVILGTDIAQQRRQQLDRGLSDVDAAALVADGRAAPIRSRNASVTLRSVSRASRRAATIPAAASSPAVSSASACTRSRSIRTIPARLRNVVDVAMTSAEHSAIAHSTTSRTMPRCERRRCSSARSRRLDPSPARLLLRAPPDLPDDTVSAGPRLWAQPSRGIGTQHVTRTPGSRSAPLARSRTVSRTSCGSSGLSGPCRAPGQRSIRTKASERKY